MGFQTVVNYENAFGIPGALYDNGPVRCAPYELVSASAAYNIIGATAYTLTTADTGNSAASGVAAAGGTGAFVGILGNSKLYSTNGTSSGALNPTMTLPNYTLAELYTMGDLIVALPGPANVGDLVAYDNTTGALLTYPATVSFTGSITGTTGALTVTAISSGQIQKGLVLSGTGIPPGTVITGTTSVSAGTYTTNYTGTAPITSETITAPSLPPIAASVTGQFYSNGAFTVTAVGSGQLGIGDVLYGTGVPANTAIIGYGTGVGGTGGYTVNTVSTFTLASGTVTADLTTQVPNASVYRFSAAGGGNVGVIKLTN